MTKTTDKRQLRLLINGVLLKYGIENLQLEFDLTSAMIGFFVDGRQRLNKVELRDEILAALNTGIDNADERRKMQARAEKVLGLNVTHEIFNDLIDFLIREDKKGKTIELYGAWAVSNPYNSPKTHQIANTPAMVERVWPAAFAGYTTQSAEDYSGSFNG